MIKHYFPFRPALDGPFAARFYKQVKELAESPTSNGQMEQVVVNEVDWATRSTTANPAQRRVYRAVWLLFRDLVRIGWSYRWNDGTVEVAAPSIGDTTEDDSDIRDAKQRIRNAMSATRLDKIVEAREFIQRVENPSAAGLARVPIHALIADGATIASDLRHAASLTDEDERLAALRQTIKPYLQIVRENERCHHTGHKLSDIWRYFRFTWATPAENTPGRTLLYLIRDSAREFHPIIGIASLENAPLRVTLRDYHLGWTLESFRDKVESLSDPAAVRGEFVRLLGHIDIALGEVDLDGLCTEDECKAPTESLIIRLAGIAARSAAERETALHEWRSRSDDDGEQLERSELGNISMEAEKHLYRRKRAERVGKLLSSSISIHELLRADDFDSRWRRFLDSESGSSAVWTALVAQKNRHIGTSLLELNVCGAIPPYNELLGGKLVALLMLSPQVLADYRERYGDRASDIATRMKGEPVVRPAELVYMGTTSLYQVGSSQYNRLRLHTDFAKPGAPEIRWQRLKKNGQTSRETTSGYGTMHISRQTLQSLDEVESSSSVNHVFGEGASPKLRMIRQALDVLFESGQRHMTDQITRHAMGRLVFGVWLASNGLAYLQGECDKPDYYFDLSERPEDATERIADHWRERWLLSRLNFPEAIERVSSFDSDQLRVSHDLAEVSNDEFVPISETTTMNIVPANDHEDWLDFVRKLYKGSSAYADTAQPELLDDLHVETALDEAIVQAVDSGRSVILTGNPGDGKTHLLRVLQSRLERLAVQPVIVLDASAIMDAEMQRKWAKALSDGRPFCAAINEAVLFNLAREYPDFAPLREATEQVEEAILYDDEPTPESSLVVFDLSLRNVMSKDIVEAVIDKLAGASIATTCADCTASECDFARNKRLLNTQLVRSGLQELLNRITRQGYHATLRELQSLISYILFAGRDCNQLLRNSGRWEFAFPQLPFKGEGALFDRLRRMDPAKIAHPIWDDILVNAQTNSDEWLPEWLPETESIDHLNTTRFEARKRAFYFCHNHGGDVLAISDNDESEFGRLLDQDTLPRDALRMLIRKINLVFGVNGNPDELHVWQSHRYSQSPQRVLYSCNKRARRDFEIAIPRLRTSMRDGFNLAQDHIIMRLHEDKRVRLHVDFDLFKLLCQAERGVPAMYLEGAIMRRLWQFMEQLSTPIDLDYDNEVSIRLLDPVSGESLTATVDMQARRYLGVDQHQENEHANNY